MSTVFDKYWEKYDAWYERNKFAYLSEIEALKRVLPKKGKGLEIGVGTGRFASILGIGYGIEPSKNMIKIARQRGVDARLGYGECLPFIDSSFDYAVIIVTLCFVDDPEKVLKETARVLKKNGRIIIGIVDKESFLGKFYRKGKSEFYKQAKFFSVKEITDLLKQAGFLSLSYYQTVSILPDALDSVEKPAQGFGKGGFVVISGIKRKKEAR